MRDFNRSQRNIGGQEGRQKAHAGTAEPSHNQLPNSFSASGGIIGQGQTQCHTEQGVFK